MFCPNFEEDLTLCGDLGRIVATESFDFQRSATARSAITVELGEHGATRHTDLSYTNTVETSGHHGATWFEHQAFVERLRGNPNTAATPREGLWSVIVASAAQASVASGTAIDIQQLLRDNDIARMGA